MFHPDHKNDSQVKISLPSASYKLASSRFQTKRLAAIRVPSLKLLKQQCIKTTELSASVNI